MILNNLFNKFIHQLLSNFNIVLTFKQHKKFINIMQNRDCPQVTFTLLSSYLGELLMDKAIKRE